MKAATATNIIEGVGESVQAAMQAVNANVLTENGLLLRTCEHGVRHPVGHLDAPQWASLTDEWARPRLTNQRGEPVPSTLESRHEQRSGAGYQSAKCCGCCPHGEA